MPWGRPPGQPRVQFAWSWRRATWSDVLRFDEHPALHLHVHRMAEPGAVVPVHSGLVGREGDRGGGLRGDLHLDAIVYDGEAVREVLHGIDVRHVDRDLVALFHREALEPE